jgi:hypothetical protein
MTIWLFLCFELEPLKGLQCLHGDLFSCSLIGCRCNININLVG